MLNPVSKLLIPNFFDNATSSAGDCYKKFMKKSGDESSSVSFSPVHQLFLEAEGNKEVRDLDQQIRQIPPKGQLYALAIAHDLAIKNNQLDKAKVYGNEVKKLSKQYNLQSIDSHPESSEKPNKTSIFLTIAKIIIAGLALGTVARAAYGLFQSGLPTSEDLLKESNLGTQLDDRQPQSTSHLKEFSQNDFAHKNELPFCETEKTFYPDSLPNSFVEPQTIAIPRALDFGQTNVPIITSYRNKGSLDIPRNIDNEEIRDLIEEMVQHGDKEAIVELIGLLDDENNFPNIDNWHLWETDIQNALIAKRDLQLIRDIFPVFKKQTLSYTNKFYGPIASGDLELVQAMHEGGMLLSKDKEKNLYNSDTHVFLFSLAYEQYDIAKYFIQHAGYDINKPYPFSMYCVEHGNCHQLYRSATDSITAAYMAVAANAPEVLKEIIAMGANCNSANSRPENADKYRMSDDDADTPLIKAIKSGREECFRILVDAPNIDLNVKGTLGRSPLIVSVWAKQFDMVQTLLDRGADPDIEDASGYTPIMFTVYHGNLPMTKALLERGANPRCIDDHARNLWHHAVRSKSTELLPLLKEKIPEFIDEEDQFGKSALFDAVDDRNPEVVEALIENGASLLKTTRNLSAYTREKLNFQKNQEIDIHTFARATLNKLDKELSDTKYKEEKLQDIKSMDEVIAILDNARLIAGDKIADTIHSKPVQNAWDSELNNIELSVGSAKEIEDKIHKMAPSCVGEFAKILAQTVAGKSYNPNTLVSALAIMIEVKYAEAEESFMRRHTLLIAPEILCAFSDDRKMQNHLKMLWKQLTTQS